MRLAVALACGLAFVGLSSQAYPIQIHTCALEKDACCDPGTCKCVDCGQSIVPVAPVALTPSFQLHEIVTVESLRPSGARHESCKGPKGPFSFATSALQCKLDGVDQNKERKNLHRTSSGKERKYTLYTLRQKQRKKIYIVKFENLYIVHNTSYTIHCTIDND